MGMNRQAKEEAVGALSGKLSRAKAAIVANFTGLDVASVTEIRSKFREAGVDYKVVKNTLMKRALAGTAIAHLGDAFAGPTAIAFKYDHEVGKLGKIAEELTKRFDKFQVKAGFIENDVLTGDVVATMASLPTLDEARAQLLGVINAPAAKLLAQINAPGTQVAGVIQAWTDKQEKGEAA
jgi:large subunit ribosomal protein L10